MPGRPGAGPPTGDDAPLPTTGPADAPADGALRFDAIVVAAGASRRMDGRDKLTARVGDRPLLGWTLAALAAAPGIDRVVVAVAAERLAETAGATWLPPCVVAVVAGGARRQDSVAAAFAALDPPDDRIVLVHDGARPSVSPALVRAVAEATAGHGAAIPVVRVAETVKRIADGLVVETIDRTALATAQTPQGVRAGSLRAAWVAFPPDGPREFTDEAALLEAARIEVHAIPGEVMNIKVTVPADLERAAAALGAPVPGTGSGSPAAPTAVPGVRIGLGSDSHPFGPGEPLALGGIAIAGGPRLHGHSDGDVALHAVADALLGAAALGDLGRMFPADASTPPGTASTALLVDVVARLRATGLTPASVDLTVVAARPRLAGHLDAMRDAIAGVLGIAPGAVDVKASTGNLAGMEGAGRGISAQAIVVVRTLP
jgi:2-C-methyl-D-erythritol 4-phosphate cytidylyltransferase/2-C-methyl-D-erythritol 2,4-cyclodiphosphate synthase